MSQQLTFPRQHARTRRFTLGRPRGFDVAPDGTRVLFLRSASGDDPVTSLWSVDVATGEERLLVDAAELAGDHDVPAEERARRERAREMAEGIVSYACDRDRTVAAFVVAGRLFTVDVTSGEVTEEHTGGPAFDARPAPDGDRVAFVAGGGLHVLERGGSPRPVASEEGVTWGLAEFVAAEEMGRGRGYWWSPDGAWLAAARVDTAPVETWHLADPANPQRPPADQRYPQAGTANADVQLALFPVDGDGRVDVAWDRSAFPYLADVVWGSAGPLTLLVQSRDQRRWQVLAVDAATGATEVLREDRDENWLELVPGAPAWLDGNRLVMVLDLPRGEGGTRTIVVDDEPVTPAGLQVRSVVDASGDTLWFTASPHPTESHLYRLDVTTNEEPTLVEIDRCSLTAGVHGGSASGDVAVLVSAGLDAPDTTATLIRGGEPVTSLTSHAQRPLVTPNVELLELTSRRLNAALLRPRHGPHADADGKLPVLLDPYGGPHAQRVLRAQGAYLTSQWFADQGFVVLVVDGAGTPRGPEFEREVAGDLAAPVLDDQIAALHAAAGHEPRMDLDRVAIRGWSFGGFLAALAVVRRPDVFHAGIAGAPVTDWRLYDTHYTERYLGHPDLQPDAYRRSSVIDGLDLVDPAPAPAGRRMSELLVIHGLADDNVAAAHSLRLSSAMLAAGRPHRFLPLSGVTHMTPQEVVAERLLELQLGFLHDVLG